MGRTRSGKVSYETDATNHGRLFIEKRKLERKRKAVVEGKLKLTRTTQHLISTPPKLKRKREEIEEEKAKSEALTKVKLNVTRSSGIAPRCSSYGRYRCALYKRHGFFFCSPCALYDTVVEKWDIDSENCIYKCVAGHTSFIFPTTKIKQTYLPSKPLFTRDVAVQSAETNESAASADEDNCSSEDEEDSVDEMMNEMRERERDNIFSPFAATQRILDLEYSPADPPSVHLVTNPEALPRTHEIAELKAEVKRLKSKLKKEQNKKEKNAPIEKEDLPQEKKVKQTKNVVNANLVAQLNEAISNVLNNVPQFKNLGGKRVTNALTSVFWKYGDGLAQEGLITKVSRWLRDNVFKVGDLLKMMDLKGGVLNYEGVEIMRSLEVKGRRNFRESILPSRSRLQKFQVKMNKVGETVCPYEDDPTEQGEGFKFDPKKAIEVLFEGYGLTEIAKHESVILGVSVDGTNISKKIKTMVGGLKINAKQAICPITKLPFFHDPRDPDADVAGMQSNMNCHPLAIYEGGETKHSFFRHKPQFDFVNSCRSAGPNNPFPDWKPLTVSVELDMKGSWEGTLVGHGVKKFADTCPCQQCATISDELHVANPTHCSRWCQKLHSEKGPEWQCYHHDFISEAKVTEMKREVESVKQLLLVTIDEILTNTKMISENVDVPKKTSASNPRSIHFIPSSLQEKAKFSNRLTRELLMRGLPGLDDMTMRRERLRDALRRERYLRKLKTQIEHGTADENALFLVMQSIPCILHCANRVNLKIFSMLLEDGLAYAKKGMILSEFNAEGRRIDEFLLGVATIVNTTILGTVGSPSQWQVPTNDSAKLLTEIGPICMVNDKSVKVVDCLEQLIHFCIPPTAVDNKGLNRYDTWLKCIPHYRSAMMRLRQHQDFTDSDIEAFQKDFDLFNQDWMKLHGKDGITNYIHLMSAGHMADYMYEWRNLYRHSQQGWESLNNLIKSFWFRRTGRGGATGRGKGKKSKLASVAKWLQRRMMWMGGWTEESVLAQWDILQKAEKEKAKENAAAEDTSFASAAAAMQTETPPLGLVGVGI